MNNTTFRWTAKADNFVSDVKISKTIITFSPSFMNILMDKVAVVYSDTTTDECIIGFMDNIESAKGMKRSVIRRNQITVPKSVMIRFPKGNYDANFIGHSEGISAYRLSLV